MVSTERAHGIAATLSALRAPQVESGHVAAWVGIGGPGTGPGGSDQWLQVGLSALPDSTTTSLYYEVKQSRTPPRYVEIGRGIEPGARHRVAVLETPSRPHRWEVWVDGRRTGAPVFLPGSDAGFRPIATAETWDGGRPACNRFGYRFERVALTLEPEGSWQALVRSHVLEDRGYRLIRRAAASFLAVARR